MISAICDSPLGVRLKLTTRPRNWNHAFVKCTDVRTNPGASCTPEVRTSSRKTLKSQFTPPHRTNRQARTVGTCQQRQAERLHRLSLDYGRRQNRHRRFPCCRALPALVASAPPQHRDTVRCTRQEQRGPAAGAAIGPDRTDCFHRRSLERKLVSTIHPPDARQLTCARDHQPRHARYAHHPSPELPVKGLPPRRRCRRNCAAGYLMCPPGGSERAGAYGAAHTFPHSSPKAHGAVHTFSHSSLKAHGAAHTFLTLFSHLFSHFFLH